MARPFLYHLILSHRLLLRKPHAISQSRRISSYGYTQASALLYSQHGEPKDVLRLHNYSLPPPHSNLLTLQTLASPINPADINLIQGSYPTPSTPHFQPSLLGAAIPSAVPGSEACFKIASLGSTCTGHRPDDWLIPLWPGFGCWRTNLQLSSDAAHESLLTIRASERDGLSPTAIATIGVNPCTAYRLLSDFGTLRKGHSGDWWVQNGANSGVGRMAIQIGRQRGLRSINIVRERADEAATEALKDELRALGADVVVTETELMSRGFGDKLREEWLDGGRCRLGLGLNCVGGRAARAMAMLLDDGGEMVTYGAMAKRALEIPAGMLIFRDLRFRGFWVSRWARGDREGKVGMVRDILGMMRRGEVRESGGRAVEWGLGTTLGELTDEVQQGLDGKRAKGVFVFSGNE